MILADRMIAMPSPARKAIALALVPLAVAVVWVCLVMPAHWITTSQSEWRMDASRELARARGRAQSLESLRQEAANFPQAHIWQRSYGLSGEGGANAVQRDVAALAASTSLTTQSIAPLPAEEEGPLTGFVVRASLRGTAGQMKAFLLQLKQHPRYLRARRIVVSAPQTQRSDENPDLEIALDIVGYAAARPELPKEQAT